MTVVSTDTSNSLAKMACAKMATRGKHSPKVANAECETTSSRYLDRKVSNLRDQSLKHFCAFN